VEGGDVIDRNLGAFKIADLIERDARAQGGIENELVAGRLESALILDLHPVDVSLTDVRGRTVLDSQGITAIEKHPCRGELGLAGSVGAQLPGEAELAKAVAIGIHLEGMGA